MLLVIDCDDSFVETLARYGREAGVATTVLRHRATDLAAIAALAPRAIMLSPGPGRPSDLPLLRAVIDHFPITPLFGVCLGHQALCEAYGGTTVRAPRPCHGQASPMHHEGDPLFAGVPSPFDAGRYHSLLGAIDPRRPLRPIAYGGDGLLMAVRHAAAPHIGVQFHPESLLTPSGRTIMGNFLREAGLL